MISSIIVLRVAVCRRTHSNSRSTSVAAHSCCHWANRLERSSDMFPSAFILQQCLCHRGLVLLQRVDEKPQMVVVKQVGIKMLGSSLRKRYLFARNFPASPLERSKYSLLTQGEPVVGAADTYDVVSEYSMSCRSSSNYVAVSWANVDEYHVRKATSQIARYVDAPGPDITLTKNTFYYFLVIGLVCFKNADPCIPYASRMQIFTIAFFVYIKLF